MKKWKKRRTWTLAMTLVLLAVLSLSACGSKLSIRQPRLRPRLPDMLWM